MRDATAWLAVETRATRGTTRRDLALGRALAQHPLVEQALTSGALRTEQARVIVEADRCVPGPGGCRDPGGGGGAMLVELAARHDARELRIIGKRILDTVAPEIGDSHEESRARGRGGVPRRRRGRLHHERRRQRPRATARFAVPSRIGKMLKRHLQALANPARHTEAELRDETGGVEAAAPPAG